jgi:transposase-like protein
MHLSKERTIFICYQFFKHIRAEYGKKPIYTDGAQWYIDACKWLRLKHIVYGTELKNIMERFIQQIKDGTECFDDHFPCMSWMRYAARLELVKDVSSISTYGNRWNQVHKLPDKIQLS